MTEYPKCPQCSMENTYHDGTTFVCPDCGHEFVSVENTTEEEPVARDCNGTPLADGDSVTVIKDLKVKGSSMVVKQGTKVKPGESIPPIPPCPKAAPMVGKKPGS